MRKCGVVKDGRGGLERSGSDEGSASWLASDESFDPPFRYCRSYCPRTAPMIRGSVCSLASHSSLFVQTMAARSFTHLRRRPSRIRRMTIPTRATFSMLGRRVVIGRLGYFPRRVGRSADACRRAGRTGTWAPVYVGEDWLWCGRAWRKRRVAVVSGLRVRGGGRVLMSRAHGG